MMARWVDDHDAEAFQAPAFERPWLPGLPWTWTGYLLVALLLLVALSVPLLVHR